MNSCRRNDGNIISLQIENFFVLTVPATRHIFGKAAGFLETYLRNKAEVGKGSKSRAGFAGEVRRLS